MSNQVMDGDREAVALSVEACWNGLPMDSVLLVPGAGFRPYTIGDASDVSFPIDGSAMRGPDVWTLVGMDGTVRVPPGADASTDGDRVRLARGQRVLVSFDSFSFSIRAVSPPRRLRLPVELNRTALAWACGGVLLAALLAAGFLILRPAIPESVRGRLVAVERAVLVLARDVDEALARLWPRPPAVPVSTGPPLPCEPVGVIDVGATGAGPAVGGGGALPGPPGRRGAARGISWSSSMSAGADQEAGSLLGYGMCMLPEPSEVGD